MFDLAGFWERSPAELLESMFTDEVTLLIREPSLRRLRGIIEAPAALRGIEAAEPDRPGWVRIVLPVESVDVAYGQLLSLGADVEVLEPEALRKRLAAASTDMAALYR